MIRYGTEQGRGICYSSLVLPRLCRSLCLLYPRPRILFLHHARILQGNTACRTRFLQETRMFPDLFSKVVSVRPRTSSIAYHEFFQMINVFFDLSFCSVYLCERIVLLRQL